MTPITIKVDFDMNKMAEEYAEGNSGYSLKDVAKREVESRVSASLVQQIVEKLDINSLKETGYSRDWLREEAKKILNEKLQKEVQDYCTQWIKDNLSYKIKAILIDEIEKIIVPTMQKTIASMLVVNQEAVEQELFDLRQELEGNQEE